MGEEGSVGQRVTASRDRLLTLTFTVEQVAMLLGISRTTAYESVKRGEIPAVRLGQRLVVPKNAVAAMLGVAPDELTSPAVVAAPAAASRATEKRSRRPRQEALWPETGQGRPPSIERTRRWWRCGVHGIGAY